MGKVAFCNENVEEAKRMKSERSSTALRRPSLDAIEEMQKKSCSRWGREAKFEGEREEGDGTVLAMLRTLMAFAVRRKKTRRS